MHLAFRRIENIAVLENIWMLASRLRKNSRGHFAWVVAFTLTLLALWTTPSRVRADEPYARTRDYDLQHSKIALRFDIDQKKVIGDVTHSLSILRDGTSKIAFDSVGLTIQGVTVNKSPAKFQSAANKLVIPLPAASHPGEKFEIEIRYEGKPAKGLYFILPDKDYPNRPKQIWTQGESEDTRYYLPTYDYPNDRLTTETILTVPASWLTVANGKLINVSDAPNSMKTWTWRESVPSSTYLITVVAGEFDEIKETFHNLPLSYYAPKGRGDRLAVNYGRTPGMIDAFNKKIGVDYPWEKYAQVMVDDFVAGGMENSSATTNTASSLKHPKLVPEFPTDEDDLISHELAHQWFGDLVTCKDWADVWLNEGFADFFETVWREVHYPKDQTDYKRWSTAREWFSKTDLYAKPVVRFDFDDANSDEFDGNAYEKAGFVLYMLRRQIGEEQFWRGVKHYLEVHRGQNVVTADFVKAIEETTHINNDRFFNEWIYGAGAPKFDLSYSYDDAKHQVALKIKQTQKLEGRVGIFQAPVEVEITTATGPKLYPITVAKAAETFALPSDSAPLMVLFDKGGHILKLADFHKEKNQWLYQLKHAAEFSDRADAAVALGKIKNDEEAVAALGTAMKEDKAPGIRAIAADALSHVTGSPAAQQLLAALDANDDPLVRAHIVAALGYFKDESMLPARLEAIARDDHSYRARAAALQSLGRLKSPNAFATVTSAVSGDSPDGYLRDAGLRALGYLGDDKAAPVLLEWSSIGKPIPSRMAALASLARLDKENKDLTRHIASYLSEPRFPIREAAIFALGNRGDTSAIPALEALLQANDLSIEMIPMIKEQIAKLQKRPDGKGKLHADDSEEEDKDLTSAGQSEVTQRLDKLEHLVQEMSDRLKSIESRLPPPKKQHE
jgi:aminopeptidase N